MDISWCVMMVILLCIVVDKSSALSQNLDDENVYVTAASDSIADHVVDTLGSTIQLPYEFQDIHSDFVGLPEENVDSTPSSSRVRKRRNVGGAKVPEVSASQSCDGITLEWNPLLLPFSPGLRYTNSEFKHYNVYRSNVFFDDVTGMKPYTSGLTDTALRDMNTTLWTDRYPTAMVDWYYAVTIVDGNGREEKSIQAIKVMFVGAIEKKGKPFLMIPGKLRGRALHHSVAFNPNRNEYLVVFDWDADYDGIPDHLFAERLNQNGRIVDKVVLNMTTTIPGSKGGNQGWPSAVFNPMRNEYLVVYHLRSIGFFSNKYVILGQKLFADKTERAEAPKLIANFGSIADAKEPKLLYNPKTGGYVGTIIADKKAKDIVAIFLNAVGGLVTSKAVCNFKTDSYEHNLFLDSKRSEFYFTCSLETRGVTADFKLKAQPFVLLMTKMDANGAHAANTASAETKSLIGYSAKRYTRLQGYYNDKTDRYNDHFIRRSDSQAKTGQNYVENYNFQQSQALTCLSQNTISSVSVIMTQQFFWKNTMKYSCPTPREVKTPVALPMPISGGHYLIWQERSPLSWNIGGYLMEGNFKLTDGLQKNPVVVYNTVRGLGFVVWQEDLGREIRLIGRHFTKSTFHTCSPSCSANQKCALHDTCVSRAADGCKVNNGGCSNICTSSSQGRVACSCPSYMKLRSDQKTCELSPCYGTPPLKDPVTHHDLFCGRVACPKHSYCDIHPTDLYAKCCPELLPEYTALIASQGVIWRAVVNEKRHKVTIERMPFTQGIVIVALAYDPKEKRIYWSDVKRSVIKRAYMDGTGEETIFPFVRVVDGLCLDVDGRQIYWTDTGFNRIERANLDGSGRQQLVKSGLDEPRSIVLYKSKRQMYWTDWGKAAKIERASMDGTQRKTIISDGLVWPNGLTIDEELGVLYWADAKLDKIETSNLEGGSRSTLVDKAQAQHPFSLAILNQRLFWSDWMKAGLQSADKKTGKYLGQVIGGLFRPKGMVLLFSKPPAANTCPDPGSPKNGGRHPAPDASARYAIDTTLIFTCKPGYTMIGPNKRDCMKSGKWSEKATFCKVRPVLTAHPVNTTVNEGDSAVLKCSASVQGKRIRVKWHKNGSPLLPSSDLEYFVGMNGNLVFLTIRFEDRGIYTCIAENQAGKVTATAFLGVRGKIKLRECGRPRYKTRQRIVGGRRAGRGAHPWQVMLWNTPDRKHFCGGTLVTDRWIVTAAHCVYRFAVPSTIKVRLGKHVRNRDEKYEQSIDADMIKIHPRYDSITFDSDIALVRTSKKVIFTDYIQPICLPNTASDYTLININQTGLISGWGKRKESRRQVALRLHETSLPIVDQATCKTSHPKYIVTANMFCAGYKNSSIGDACKGDSGGPFSVNNPEPAIPDQTRQVLVGVVSWGDGCGRFGKYGVYTRLTNFVDWIMNQIV